jgi:hypothetical protein
MTRCKRRHPGFGFSRLAEPEAAMELPDAFANLGVPKPSHPRYAIPRIVTWVDHVGLIFSSSASSVATALARSI